MALAPACSTKPTPSMLSSACRKFAAAKSTEATTATRPIRLNQPVNHPPPGPTELRRPVVDAPRRWHRRRQFRHGEGDAQDQARDHRPADRDRDRAAVEECLAVAGKAA